MSKAILVVGATGTGKTTYNKKCLGKVSPKSIHLYDVNNEYKDYYKKPFIPFTDFMNQAKNIENGVIVFEEATIFLNNRLCNQDLIDILVRKRHTNNTVFMVFHSLRNVPRYVYDLSNIVVLHKTNDSEKSVHSKFEDERLTEVFKQVNSHNDKHYNEIFAIY